MAMRLEVMTDGQSESSCYGKLLDNVELVPANDDMMSFFDEMTLSDHDTGWPLATVEGRAWSSDLKLINLHLHCPVERTFFYDRPWRQHLLDEGWQSLDEAEEILV